MNAYSYIRWSSAQQTDGDSFLRQTETARRVCAEKGWNLVDLPPDKGVSAFKGKNLSHSGILGQFIKRVQTGLIETPCVLVLEKLDRFSRREVDEVLPIFLALLKSGVQVYSALEGDHYTQEKIKSDPITGILKMTMAFVGANQYSATIGARVKAAKRRKRERALSGKSEWMFDCCPAWFDFESLSLSKENGKYVVNEKAKTVKRIFELYQKLGSFLSVARHLNTKERQFKPLQTANDWSATTVKGVLESRYTIGEFKGVKNYFPAVISEETFNEVQRMIASNARGSGRVAQLHNFLRGQIFCSECGKNAVLIRNKAMVRYFGCNGKDKGTCTAKPLLRAEELEVALFLWALKTTPDELLKDTDKHTLAAVRRLETELANLERDARKAFALQDMDMDFIRTELERIKKRQAEVKQELEVKRASLNSPKTMDRARAQIDEVLNGVDGMAISDLVNTLTAKLRDDEYRKKLQEPLSNILDKVVCQFGKGTFYAVSHGGIQSPEFSLVREAKTYYGGKEGTVQFNPMEVLIGAAGKKTIHAVNTPQGTFMTLPYGKAVKLFQTADGKLIQKAIRKKQ